MSSKLSAFVVWLLVAASAVFWGLRGSARAPAVPANAGPVGDVVLARGDLTRLLGTAPVAPVVVAPVIAESTRFRLTGVMAPKVAGRSGVALIAIDGKPARAFRVGTTVDASLVLQSVSLRSASLGAGGATPAFTLELPLPVPAATGTPPPFNNGMNGPGQSGAGANPQMPQMPPPGTPDAQPTNVPGMPQTQ